MMKKGVFIALYGVNNIGKSTQAKRLVDRLNEKGYSAVYVKYPVYDLEPTGTQINAILRSGGPQLINETALQQLYTQNRHDYEPVIRKALSEGKIIIAEDYTATGISWGTAKGMTLKDAEKMNEGLLKEDYVILLKGKRFTHAREKNHLHETNDALVDKVAQILEQLQLKYGWDVVVTKPTIADTANEIWDKVMHFISARSTA